MKLLKTTRKIIFLLAVVLAGLAFFLSPIIDEGGGMYGAFEFSLAYFVALGPGVFLLLLMLGSIFYFSPNDNLHKTGLAFTSTVFIIYGSLPLVSKLENVQPTGIMVFVAAILYLTAMILTWIEMIANVSEQKQNAKLALDPDNDETLQLIAKWKRYKDEGVISEEEFEAKRKEILSL